MSYRRNINPDLVYDPTTGQYIAATGYGRNPSLDLIYNSETESYDPAYPDFCTLTLEVAQAEATITFSTGEVIGNQCTVPSGTTITYTVTKEWYETVTGSITLVQDQSINITLTPEQGRLVVNTTPADASVTFDVGEVSGHTCVVNAGTNVTYTVSKPGYTTVSNTVFVDNTTIEVDVELTALIYTFTITPAPQDAVVTLTAEGFEQEGNSIQVTYGTVVTYTVSHEDYFTITSSRTIIEDQTLIINLKPDTTVFYTITIVPTPNTATVQLRAEGYTQVGNSIKVPAHTVVQYLVSAEHFTSADGYIFATQDETYPVKLKQIPYPDNQITYDNTVTCYSGQTITYWVDKPGYIAVTGTTDRIKSNTRVTVPLVADNLGLAASNAWIYPPRVDNKKVSERVKEGSDLGGTRAIDVATVTIDVHPEDAEVILQSDSGIQDGNSITVKLGSQVSWNVRKDYYFPVMGAQYVVGDQVELVNLIPMECTISVSTVSTGFIELIQNDKVVASGTGSVTTKLQDHSRFIIHIVAEGYQEYTSPEPIQVTRNYSYHINLTPAPAIFTLHCNVLDAAISFNGQPASGNTINVPLNSTVTWEVTKEGYVTQSGSHVMDELTYEENVTLEKIPCTYTLQPNVAEYTANFTVVSGQEISRTSDSITVEYGSVINWIVNAPDYISSMGTNITVTSDVTQEVELEPALP